MLRSMRDPGRRKAGDIVPSLPSSFVIRHSSFARAGVPVAGLVGLCLLALAAALPTASRPASSRPPASQPAGQDVQAYYEDRLAQLAPDDANGLYALALECSNRDRPDLAARLCRQILQTWPEHRRAKVLLRAASRRLAAASRPGPASRPPAADAAAASRPAPASRTGPRSVLTMPRVLSPKAINRIRLAEFRVDDMDDRPRIELPRTVIQEFLDEADKTQAMSQVDKDRFNQPGNDDKLRYIINITGNRYFDQIQMTSEPKAMVVFRKRVWPVISRGCGSPACHGGDNAGHLRFVLPPFAGQAMATNFYIITRFEDAQGPLVDREHPEASRLLQFGLSAEQAEAQHPVAIPPPFSGPGDPKYLIVLDWIRQLRRPALDCGITDAMWQNMPRRPTTAPAE
jgi:hypothetical protein